MAPFCVFKKSPGKPGISLVSTGRPTLSSGIRKFVRRNASLIEIDMKNRRFSYRDGEIVNQETVFTTVIELVYERHEKINKCSAK